MLVEIVLGLLVVLGFLYYQLTKNKNYWHARNIPNTGFKFFVGDDGLFLTQKESVHEWALRLYKEFEGVGYLGAWTLFGSPYVFIRNDFDMIRNIWIKDFDHFAIADSSQGLNASTWPATRHEKLLIKNIQGRTGDDWKDLRSTFSPIFTSGKLRIMTPLLQAINKKMNKYVSTLAEEGTMFEAKEFAGKFSIDGLASCAFGVEAGSFDGENSEFLYHGKNVFATENFTGTTLLVQIFTPNIVKKAAAKLGFPEAFASFFGNKHGKFLMEVLEEVFKQRKASKLKRNDLIDLIIEAIEGDLDDNDDTDIHCSEQFEKDAKLVGYERKKKITYDDAISTALFMLSAGYDTTGTTMSFILYQLAMNQDAQEALCDEIRDAGEDVDKLSYETIQGLPYLDAVIHETLRMHPVAGILERVCSKEYKVPGHDLVIPKGGIVRLNNVGICYDPEIFPDPKRFNPERFLKENRGDRNPYSFMGFSLGPRNCLAMRFAMFEMKMCISHLVANFRFLPCEKTIKDLEYDPKNFLGGTKGGLWIQCEHR